MKMELLPGSVTRSFSRSASVPFFEFEPPSATTLVTALIIQQFIANYNQTNVLF